MIRACEESKKKGGGELNYGILHIQGKNGAFNHHCLLEKSVMLNELQCCQYVISDLSVKKKRKKKDSLLFKSGGDKMHTLH